MTTDSWARVKAGFTSLWRRQCPAQATAVEADLEASRAVLAARKAEDSEIAVAELTAEWRSRLRRAAEADQEAVAEVRRLVEEFRPLLPTGAPGLVKMTARASGRSRINQAARDQTVISG